MEKYRVRDDGNAPFFLARHLYDMKLYSFTYITSSQPDYPPHR